MVKASRLNRIGIKLPLIFFIVGFVAPAIAITYFYTISTSLIGQSPDISTGQLGLLEGSAIIIIVLIAADAGILGYFISRSFTKPIGEFYKATKELEKGNFDVRVQLSSDDELAALGKSLNDSAQKLACMTEEHQRLDHAKSEFLSITSHELRTPITPLKAQLQMLQQDFYGPLTNKQQESITVILRNVERLDRIIEDFLEVSRIEAARLKFSFRPTQPEEIIHETVNLMQGFAHDKNITITTNTTNLPIVELDPDRLSQILRNLLHNAVKFSPTNSTIEVTAEVVKGFILFSVQDSGSGLSSEDQIRVFEPFYQVEKTSNRKYGGTGLGLTICRGIVESQKGKIWVESRLGIGSTFHFTIPLTPVHNIEPIKVLFSPKAEIETRLLEQFTTILGPMGSVEFTELKQKHALGKDDLYAYIDSLEETFILRHENAETFRTTIKKIFGEEPRLKEESRPTPAYHRGSP
jgi:signal transduction histidine kinase